MSLPTSPVLPGVSRQGRSRTSYPSAAETGGNSISPTPPRRVIGTSKANAILDDMIGSTSTDLKSFYPNIHSLLVENIIEIESLKSSCVHNETKYNAAVEAKSNLETTVAELRFQLESAYNDREQLAKTIDQATSRARIAENNVHSLEERLEVLTKELSDLRMSSQDSNTTLLAHKRENNMLLSKLNELQSRYDSLEERDRENTRRHALELSTLREEYEESAKMQEKIHSQALLSASEDATSRTMKLESQILSLKNSNSVEVSRLEDKLQFATARAEKLESQVLELEKSLLEREGSLQALRSELRSERVMREDAQKQVDSLNKRLNLSENYSRDQESRLRDEVTRASAASAEASDLRSVIQLAQQREKRLETTIQSLKSELESLQHSKAAELESLQRSMDMELESLQRLKSAELESLKEKLKIAENALASTTESLKSAEQAVTTERAALRSVEASLQSERESLASSLEARDQLDSATTLLERDLLAERETSSQLQVRLEAARGDIEGLRRILQSAEESAAEFASFADAARAERDSALSRCESLHARLEEAETDCAAALQERAQSARAAAELESLLQSSRVEAEVQRREASQQLEQQALQLQQLEEALAARDVTVAALEKNLAENEDAAKLKVEQLNSSLSGVEAALAAAEGREAIAQERLQSLSAEKEASRTQITLLEGLLDASRKRTEDLERAGEIASRSVEELNASLEAARASLVTSKDVEARLEAELAAARRELEALNAELQQLQIEQQQLKQELRQHQGQIEQQQQEIEQLQLEKDALQQQVSDLTEAGELLERSTERWRAEAEAAALEIADNAVNEEALLRKFTEIEQLFNSLQEERDLLREDCESLQARLVECRRALTRLEDLEKNRRNAVRVKPVVSITLEGEARAAREKAKAEATKRKTKIVYPALSSTTTITTTTNRAHSAHSVEKSGGGEEEEGEADLAATAASSSLRSSVDLASINKGNATTSSVPTSVHYRVVNEYEQRLERLQAVNQDLGDELASLKTVLARSRQLQEQLEADLALSDSMLAAASERAAAAELRNQELSASLMNSLSAQEREAVPSGRISLLPLRESVGIDENTKLFMHSPSPVKGSREEVLVAREATAEQTHPIAIRSAVSGLSAPSSPERTVLASSSPRSRKTGLMDSSQIMPSSSVSHSFEEPPLPSVPTIGSIFASSPPFARSSSTSIVHEITEGNAAEFEDRSSIVDDAVPTAAPATLRQEKTLYFPDVDTISPPDESNDTHSAVQNESPLKDSSRAITTTVRNVIRHGLDPVAVQQGASRASAARERSLLHGTGLDASTPSLIYGTPSSFSNDHATSLPIAHTTVSTTDRRKSSPSHSFHLPSSPEAAVIASLVQSRAVSPSVARGSRLLNGSSPERIWEYSASVEALQAQAEAAAGAVAALRLNEAGSEAALAHAHSLLHVAAEALDAASAREAMLIDAVAEVKADHAVRKTFQEMNEERHNRSIQRPTIEEQRFTGVAATDDALATRAMPSGTQLLAALRESSFAARREEEWKEVPLGGGAVRSDASYYALQHGKRRLQAAAATEFQRFEPSRGEKVSRQAQDLGHRMISAELVDSFHPARGNFSAADARSRPASGAKAITSLSRSSSHSDSAAAPSGFSTVSVPVGSSKVLATSEGRPLILIKPL